MTVFKDKKALEVLSFSFAVSQAETTGSGTTGGSAGKAKFEEFQIEKYVDQASAPLYNACTGGAHFPSVCLAVRKAGGDPLLYLAVHLPPGVRDEHQLERRWRRRRLQRDHQIQVRRDGCSVHPTEAGRHPGHKDVGSLEHHQQHIQPERSGIDGSPAKLRSELGLTRKVRRRRTIDVLPPPVCLKNSLALPP